MYLRMCLWYQGPQTHRLVAGTTHHDHAPVQHASRDAKYVVRVPGEHPEQRARLCLPQAY